MPSTPSLRVRELDLLAGKPHRPSLSAWAKGATRVEIYVSFLFPEGVALVRDLLKLSPVDLTVSTYLRATRKAALVELLSLLESSPGLRVRVATGDKDGFHGKVYRYTYGDGTARIVVGSANLSKGGLDGGGEVSLSVAGKADVVPGLDGSEFSALTDTAWATASDTGALARVIAGYKESKLGRELGGALYSDVASFVGVGKSNDDEDEAIELVGAAAPLDLDGTLEGDRSGNDEQFIFDPALKRHEKWASLAARLSIGDIVYLGLTGRKTLRGHRLLARYVGTAPPLGTPHVVLFLKTIKGSKLRGAAVKWRNRMIPREELTKEAGAALAADTTPLESDS